ncbi:2-polyprenyl-3-methyl-6-methoxy-1,4-benzoquinone monooxygenase [Polynucleobacter sp. IMCC30063]|uniref:2-polyprenyl-3-methyl-6-methoxy-1,4-benzoquinone monooxygenase n=1 Tax=unclassified Polynucleobacter TaxID=2640945 RepID=UPI001F32B884|nr:MULTISPECIES: 2-polyprenyl-3-methyl-6-methoxy-1,4-benzoquinone monooxygenase [unclassified Polynucleobacter]MCE7505036.1 2-polyprenyl-3-methyl-6-methoxy-1,4-benzoquinone monooxygenase [Polynucleobacter sp. IMCC30063]MCE7526172.1 2-polyprenyl-3-methyl-6-methoxy-1,4-benzoquinone monooxygenase [Polynucleobacter sp. IMCC 30228]MCE7528479.1 2-polyprenyl-3-methyl-6-methoxy-1,4-benzoquinone monooxygenase [Polynucleobacter sp. IMCC 29146]NBY31167.1 2-polyprenyl-3-methyl-6-methoxy-1,4-benzoquinone mo
MFSLADRFISEFDVALRSVAGGAVAQRPSPSQAHLNAVDLPQLGPTESAHAAGLMRINHVGEVCAQALYQAQKLLARDPQIGAMLAQAGQEELDHMAWCETRLIELGSHTSYFNPFWYSGAFVIGLLAGLAGDQWSLGFVAETEKQVEHHLDHHLNTLPSHDVRSRAIVDQMRLDEIEHGQAAWTAGAQTLPEPIKKAMGLVSKIMTTIAYRI